MITTYLRNCLVFKNRPNLNDLNSFAYSKLPNKNKFKAPGGMTLDRTIIDSWIEMEDIVS